MTVIHPRPARSLCLLVPPLCSGAGRRLLGHSLEAGLLLAGFPWGGGRATGCCSSGLTLCAPRPQILVHIGFLTEESGDVFSPRVLKGGPLGEMVQWADILAALYVLGHGLRITVSLKELQR